MTTARSVKKQIEHMGALPTIPTVVRKLLEMFENPKISLAEIATIISQDPVLAAKILKVVNSPIYGFPGRVSSLTQALLLLGLNVARGLLLGVSVLEIMFDFWGAGFLSGGGSINITGYFYLTSTTVSPFSKTNGYGIYQITGAINETGIFTASLNPSTGTLSFAMTGDTGGKSTLAGHKVTPQP